MGKGQVDVDMSLIHCSMLFCAAPLTKFIKIQLRPCPQLKGDQVLGRCRYQASETVHMSESLSVKTSL